MNKAMVARGRMGFSILTRLPSMGTPLSAVEPQRIGLMAAIPAKPWTSVGSRGLKVAAASRNTWSNPGAKIMVGRHLQMTRLTRFISARIHPRSQAWARHLKSCLLGTSKSCLTFARRSDLPWTKIPPRISTKNGKISKNNKPWSTSLIWSVRRRTNYRVSKWWIKTMWQSNFVRKGITDMENSL